MIEKKVGDIYVVAISWGQEKRRPKSKTPAGTGGKGRGDQACQRKQCPFKITPGVDYVLRNVADSLFLHFRFHISSLITDRMAQYPQDPELGLHSYCRNLATPPSPP